MAQDAAHQSERITYADVVLLTPTRKVPLGGKLF